MSKKLRVYTTLEDRIGDLYCPRDAVIVPAPTHVRYGFSENEVRRLVDCADQIRSEERLLSIGVLPEASFEWLDLLGDTMRSSPEPYDRPDLLSAHFQIDDTKVDLVIRAADTYWRNRAEGKVQEWTVPFVSIETLSQRLESAAPRKGRAPR